jgi:ABC-type dipeptide/oligopeptide/nickel transport system permease component
LTRTAIYVETVLGLQGLGLTLLVDLLYGLLDPRIRLRSKPA